MSRIRFSAVVAGIVALLASAAMASLAAAASSSSSGARAGTASSGPAKISLRQTRLGKVLVNSRGFTLYEFSSDAIGKDRCVSRSGCTQVWPMVKTNGRPQAGHGVKRSMLGSIQVRGAHQVTYGGHPLYTYSGDSSPGATSYAGVSQFGGVWRAVRASGKTAG